MIIISNTQENCGSIKTTIGFRILLFSIFIHVFVDSNAQWITITSPPGGVFSNIILFQDQIIAGSYGGGVLVSDDWGATWTNRNFGLMSKNINGLSANSNYIYTATDRGLYKTNDFGLTWTYLMNWPMAGYPFDAVLAFDSNVFASSASGLYRSLDEGENWEQISGDLPPWPIETILYDGQNIFVGPQGSGLYRSSDNGITWSLVSGGIFDDVTYTCVNGNSIYLSTGNDGVYRSLNGGNSWSSINEGLPSTASSSVYHDGIRLFVGVWGFGVFASDDNGDSWYEVNNQLSNANVYDIASFNGYIYAATESGIYYLDSQNAWNSLNETIFCTQISALTENGVKFLAGTYGSGLFQSMDEGFSWSEVNYGPFSQKRIQSVFVKQDSIYIGLESGIFTSFDGGINWSQPESLGLLNGRVHSIFKGEDVLLVGTESGIFHSINEGEFWEPSSGASGIINAFFVHDTCIYALSQSSLFISVDSGISWSLVDDDNTTFIGLKSMTSRGDTLYLGGFKKLYISFDSGISWIEQMVPQLPDVDGCIQAIALDNDRIIIGSLNGVFFSDDYGVTWSDSNYGLRSLNVGSLLISDSKIFAGTKGGGIYYMNLLSLGDNLNRSVENEVIVYPNPSSGVFRIRVPNKIQGDVLIEISNMMGTILHSQVSKVPDFNVDLSKHANGYYILKLETDSIRSVKRIFIE